MTPPTTESIQHAWRWHDRMAAWYPLLFGVMLLSMPFVEDFWPAKEGTKFVYRGACAATVALYLAQQIVLARVSGGLMQYGLRAAAVFFGIVAMCGVVAASTDYGLRLLTSSSMVGTVYWIIPLVASLMLARPRGGPPVAEGWFAYPLLAVRGLLWFLAIWGLFSVVASNDPLSSAIGYRDELGMWMLTVLIFMDVMRTPDLTRSMLRYALAASIYIALMNGYGLLRFANDTDETRRMEWLSSGVIYSGDYFFSQYKHLDIEFDFRPAFPFFHHNRVSNYAMMMTGLSLILVVWPERRRFAATQWLAYIALAANVWLLWRAMGRGAQLALILGMIGAAFFSIRAGKRGGWIALVAAVLLAIGGYLIAPDSQRARIDSVLESAVILGRDGLIRAQPPADLLSPERALDGNLVRRLFAMTTASRMVHAHPWFGIGYHYKTYEQVVPQFRPTPQEFPMAPELFEVQSHAHNNLLQVAAETGLPWMLGFVAMQTILFVWLIAATRRAHAWHHELRWAMSAALAVFLMMHLYGMTNYSLRYTLGHLWWMSFAAIVVLVSRCTVTPRPIPAPDATPVPPTPVKKPKRHLAAIASIALAATAILPAQEVGRDELATLYEVEEQWLPPDPAMVDGLLDIDTTAEPPEGIGPFDSEEALAVDGTAEELASRYQPPPPDPGLSDLSLQRAVMMAMEGNQGLRADARDLAAGASSLRAAQAEFLPFIELAYDYGLTDDRGNRTRRTDRQEAREEGLDDPDPFNTDAGTETVRNQGEARLTQNLPWGGSITGRGTTSRTKTAQDQFTGADHTAITRTFRNEVALDLEQPLLRGAGWLVGTADLKRARLDQINQALSYRESQRELALSVINAYYDLAQAELDVRVSLDALREVERFLEESRVKLELGRIAETEVGRAEIQLLQEKENFIQRVQTVESRRDTLLDLLGLGVSASLALSPLESQLIDVRSARIPPLDEGLEEAMATRLELAREDVSVTRAELAADVAWNDILPDLNARGGVSGFDESEYQHLSTDVDARRRWEAGLGLVVPLPNIARRESLKRAEWSLQTARENRDERRRDIAREVKGAYRDLRSAMARVRLLVRTVEQSRRSLAQENARFEAGINTSSDVREAQDDLFSAQVSYNQALAQVQVRLAAVYRALGRPLM